MRGAWKGWLWALLCVVIAVCVAALSARFGFIADWSAGARATITPQSQSLLQQLKGPIEITSYARPGDLRSKTSLLVARYRRFKHDITLKFVDPDADPVATQDANIATDGELILAWNGRTQHVTQLDEPSFSDALVRLARGGNKLVAFIAGDGERDATGKNPADLGAFVQRLSTRGIRALPLNLAQAAEVPRNANLVVLASPQAALLPASVQKLQDYVANGGNLLWLTEPGSDDLGLAPLAQALGIKRLPGQLFDAQSATATGDARMLVTSQYPPQTITDGFAVNTVFPRAAALAALPGAAWNVQPILQSGAHSWNQTAPVDAAQAALDLNSGALKGPLTFGYALSRLSPSPDKNQQRVVVIGGGDFLSNAFLRDGGNLAFGERVFDWLLGDDALASVAQPAPDAVMKPTRAQLGALTFGYLIALPILLILIGLAINWRRRRRR
ncbi:MAG TPA: GldG family protein [Rhodanobacteraceae bacterium]|nr:GldG family protein [Rhodanobacteraceae bacterium]